MLIDCFYLALALAILWKSADCFVDGAVGVAEKMRIPPMLVGLVLVSIATTSPELMTSLLAALQGHPDLALGNAVGSVIIDASVALGLAAAVSSVPLMADPRIFRSSAIVLLVAIGLAFLLCLDGTLGSFEGALLVGVYAAYVVGSYVQLRRSQARGQKVAGEKAGELERIEEHLHGMPLSKILLLFTGGFVGVLLGSEFLLKGALGIAGAFGLPPVVTGLTITAIGTSTPEIATCVVSALKRQSGIGVGNIIGADILNICWVAGLSAVAHPLSAEAQTIYFMFPAVLVIVLTMLAMLRYRYCLTRLNGAVLLSLYVVYALFIVFYVTPGSAAVPHG